MLLLLLLIFIVVDCLRSNGERTIVRELAMSINESSTTTTTSTTTITTTTTTTAPTTTTDPTELEGLCRASKVRVSKIAKCSATNNAANIEVAAAADDDDDETAEAAVIYFLSSQRWRSG